MGEEDHHLSLNPNNNNQLILIDEDIPLKKKRNLPGTPDPEAEVIALSPKTLMATNRFLCEICGKGFQRDQNLQLHRRGHNLPWKLKQKSSKGKKRVYVCPEKTCIHNDPSRALGDLTGIKKHFCRKHGEKIWKCQKCSKRYAVQSDWKAHSKTCGTKDYKCDCGTLFSRRDSFITHRAFCDALAEETARMKAAASQMLFNYQFNTTNTNTNDELAQGIWMGHIQDQLVQYSTLMSDHHFIQSQSQEKSLGIEKATHDSATALLQKAAQIGSTASSSITHHNYCPLYSSNPTVIPPLKRQRHTHEPSPSSGQTRDFLGLGPQTQRVDLNFYHIP